MGSKSLSNSKIHWVQSFIGKEKLAVEINFITKNLVEFQTNAEKMKNCNSANVMWPTCNNLDFAKSFMSLQANKNGCFYSMIYNYIFMQVTSVCNDL